MTDTAAVHDEAMAIADQGDRARRCGDHSGAREHFAQAMALERRAADGETTQPSRSILYRSAAWLALEAEDAAEAERLAACGLADREVPERIKGELRAVAEDARLRLVRPLPPPTAVSSVTLHLEGPKVGFGSASPSDVDPRVEALETMIVRTAERRSGLLFRRRGPTSKHLSQQLEPRVQYASGSVVVQLTLGGDQPVLWDANAAIVEDVQRCLTAFGEGGPEALRPHIAEDTYRENFSLLAAQLAPDGERVTSVDVHAATSTGALPIVRLRRSTREARPSKAGRGDTTTETMVGELRGADETATTNTIKLRLAAPIDATVSIQVTDAAMEDIVRPLYGRLVKVTVSKRGKTRSLLGAPSAVDP